MMFAVGILGVLSAMAVIQIGSTRNALKGDAAMRLVRSQLIQAREMAIAQRRYMEVTFDRTQNEIVIVREEPSASPTTVLTVPFEGGASLTLVSGLPDTPDAFGSSAATSFTSSSGTFASDAGTNNVVKFAPDGTLVDWNGRAANGTVFTALHGVASSARAVTVLGSTGRISAYRWTGQRWMTV
jgi:Tfp pilus assembly protein FimT